MSPRKTARHRWRFFRVGGIDQVKLETADDFANLEHLDQKLWVALSCPVKGLEFDERTLELLDSDGDGRVRVPEVIAAVDWVELRLKDLVDLTRCRPELPLAAINDQTEEGRAVLASARRVLADTGDGEATSIRLEHVSDPAKIFGPTAFIGGGIVIPDSAEAPDVRAVIEQIIATTGGDVDRSGKPGVSQEKVDAFFGQLEAVSAWWKQADDSAASIRPFGDETPAVAALVGELGKKIDDYFARCRLGAFDARAVEALNRQESAYIEIAASDLSITAEEVASFPLSRVEPDRPLPLEKGVNPAWAEKLAALAAKLGSSVAGDGTLTCEAWTQLKAALAPYQQWFAARPETSVEGLGRERIEAVLAGDARAQLGRLIERDKALAPEVQGIDDVEKLVRYHRDLHRLLNNFVSFRDFYDPGRPASFQVGTLYIDSRACSLCLRVTDPAKHAKLAALGMTYLAYCDCTRKSTGEQMTVAAVVTDGDADNLMVGRNGILYDRDGHDWDATITKIVEHPISIRQAFWSPYKRVAKFVEDQIQKFAAAKDAAVTADAAKAATGAAAGPLPFDIAKFAGIFAAIGLAVGAIGSALAAVALGFFGLTWWQMPLAILGALLVISGPSMLLAAMKLRKRNLGPILDAEGWAVNGRVKVNIPFGRSLTQLARLPEGARRSRRDPFRRKRRIWPWLLVILIVLGFAAWQLNEKGKLREWGLPWGKVVEPAAPPAEEGAATEPQEPAGEETAKPEEAATP